MILMICVFVTVIVLVSLLYFCCFKFKKCRECLNSIIRKIFWNTILRSILEKSIEIAIACAIRMYSPDMEGWKEASSTIFAGAQLVLLIVMAIGLPFYLHYNRKIVKRTKFKKKCGSVMLNLKTRGFGPKLFYFFFISRRLLLATLIVFSEHMPWA